MPSNKLILGIAVVILLLGGVFLLSKSQTNPVANAPTGTTTSTATGNSYTLAEVQTHNTPASCWAVVSGNVYDLTSWIARHPGGEGSIKRMCGTDGTDSFTRKHGSSPRPASALALLKIGTLK